MSNTLTISPAVGRTYELAQQDYRFGNGSLIAHVTCVVRKALFEGQPWWEVEACTASGTLENHGALGPERSLYIRSTALTEGAHR